MNTTQEERTEYDAEYHAIVHPLDDDRGCGCTCPKCYSRDATPKCVCSECTAKGHPNI